MKNKVYDIHCPNCGGAAYFDIKKQTYLCGYCGSKVGISEAIKEKQGFKQMLSGRLKDSMKNYRLFSATCNGCGADLIFEENEALSKCPFCGKSLIRSDYLEADGLPEALIPFFITEREARDRLEEWCQANRSRKESKALLSHIDDLKAFYLPYELVRGPVHINTARMDGGSAYSCEGFIKNAFVNRSKQLDNLLLDGMEPFDIEGLEEFDLGYIAGHRVKTADLNDKELLNRTMKETGNSYRPLIRKVFNSKAVYVDPDVSDAIRMPVLLPVYYICEGDLMAAVNGQTGKVAIRSFKDSHYYFLPWWSKAIVATLAFCLIIYGAFRLFGMENMKSLLFTGILAMFFIIVLLSLYSDTTKNDLRVVSGKKILTSGDDVFTREHGELILSDKVLEERVEEPVFFENIEDEEVPVVLRFLSPYRVLRMLLLSGVVLFLPVIIALFINGFDVSKINLGGAAVWFCIFVPVVPVYLLKFGIVELYERPWIYVIKENGSKKRYRKKHRIKITKSMITGVLRALFIPPVSLAVWFGIISFFVICYLTAGLG